MSSSGPMPRLSRLLAVTLCLLPAAAATVEADGPPPADRDIERSAAMAHLLAAAPRSGVEGQSLLLTMAVQGHAQSQYLLGVMQAEGAGAARDPAGAVAWLSRATAQGHRGAHAALARMAAEGNTPAHLALGLILRERGGAEGEEALRHLRAAAAAGDAQGLLALGALYAEGSRVEPDPAYAARLFRAAAGAAMDAVLQAHRGAARGILGPDAGRWLEVAAARTRAAHAAPPGRDPGTPELFARYWVGLALLAGAGAAADVPRGLTHHRAAAAPGFAPAEFSLGLLHERGHGLPRDLAEARRWLARAEAHGHPLAAARLAAMAAARAAK